MLPHDHHQGSTNDQDQRLPKRSKHEGSDNNEVSQGGVQKDVSAREHQEPKELQQHSAGVSDLNRQQQVSRELCFKFLVELKSLVGEKRFDEWFAHQTTVHLTDRVLYVSVVSPFLQRWMHRVFHKECQQVLLTLLGPGIVVEFQVKEIGSSYEGLTFHELKELLCQVSESRVNSERVGVEVTRERELPHSNLPVMEARGSQDDPAGNFLPSMSLAVNDDHKQQLAKSNSASKPTSIVSQKSADLTRTTVPSRTKHPHALDTFVSSQANQELIHSAMHLQLNDEHYFNGLYIYGGIGNGKTHLLQGMYQLLRDPQRSLRVMYLTAEQFANYYIQALRDKSIPAFHHKFRQLDVLIVDDVEFLEGKQGIQEEFLRTLKQLENSRKRVIFSADRHPRSFLQTRSELIDRYLSCLVKRIQEPDDFVRQQIVMQRAAHLQVSITTEVAEYLANRFRGSVRELIGAVNCLHAYHLVHQRKITLATARNVLHELERACLRIIKPQDIEQVVCEFFQISREDLHSASRARTLSLPRMIAMYLIRKHTTAAYTEIGRQFGGRNHSTVISAERKVETWLAQDLTIKLEPHAKSILAEDQAWSIRDILQILEQKLMAC